MNPFWDYWRPRCNLVLALLLLAVPGVGSSVSYADDAEVRFWLAPALEAETFQDLAPQPAAAASAVLNDSALTPASYSAPRKGVGHADRMGVVRVGYDGGFVIASSRQLTLDAGETPFLMRINGWGQLRHTNLSSQGPNENVNQFQLKRARLVFSGHAFTPDFAYFSQLDGRSSSGDNMRLLDYYLSFDFGHKSWGLDPGTIGFRTGKYKMPFTMARWLSGREFEFADRSMASTFFDVNRSFAWGLYGEAKRFLFPLVWETAIFNGLVTGGAETGSSGTLDDNFAYSARVFGIPLGDWGVGELADFEGHDRLAMRVGFGFASTEIDRSGSTEFESLRVVDSGKRLASILPAGVGSYSVSLYSVDARPAG